MVISPEEAADAIASLERPLLLGLDVDGTLAPIVPHPALARLLPGVIEAIGRLTHHPGITVVIVSGRPKRELREQFGFPKQIMVVGSHGIELDGPVFLT